jgi:hypothetical protein
MKQQAAVITKIGLAPKSVNTPDKGLVVAMKGREPRVGAPGEPRYLRRYGYRKGAPIRYMPRLAESRPPD